MVLNQFKPKKEDLRLKNNNKNFYKHMIFLSIVYFYNLLY